MIKLYGRPSWAPSFVLQRFDIREGLTEGRPYRLHTGSIKIDLTEY